MKSFRLRISTLCLIIFSIILFSTKSIAAIQLSENFTSPNFPVANWANGSFVLNSGTWDVQYAMGLDALNAYNSSGGAAKLNRYLASYLTSPSINSVGIVSFYYKNFSTVLGGGTFSVQKSVNNGAFTNIGTVTFTNTTTYTFYSVVVNDPSNNIKIRISCPNTNAGFLCIDEILITDMGQSLTTNPSSLSEVNYSLGNGPSSSQSFNLFGTNLTGFPSNIILTAPVDYEISSNNSTFFTSLNIPYTNSTLSSTTIYVRLKAGLSINTYNSEIISISGGGATTINVTCNGNVTTAPSPILNVNNSNLSGFSYVFGSGPSVAQSYSISGTNLNGFPGNIVITAPVDYELSTDYVNFYNTLNISFTSSTLASVVVYVRLKSGLAVNFYNSESILNDGGGATTTVVCNGSVSPPPSPTLSVNPTTLSGFNYIEGFGPSSPQSYNLSGSNLTGFPSNITITSPVNYEISFSSVAGFTSNINVAYSSAILPSTTIYVRLKSGLTTATYNSEIIANSGGGANTVNLTCNGNVSPIPSPILTISSTNLSGFSYIVGSGPSASQTYNISGSYLTGYPSDIVITASTNYEISLNNSTFANTINIPFTSASLTSTTVFVRLISGLAVGSYNSEVITNSGGGASTFNVTCNGNVTEIPPAMLSVNIPTLSGFNYFSGSGPSASQSFSISGNNLTGFPGNIIITAPLNYEVSNDNITFSTSTSIPYSSSNLSSTTIFVRLKSGLAIAVYNSEIITITGGGANNTVTCNGEVKALSTSCATDLIISEYHEPLAGNNKGVEIYNGTGQNVDLSNYYIGVIVNGGTDIESSQVLSGILGDKQTACIYNDTDADPNFRLQGDINITWINATWNGDDAVYLLKGGSTQGFIIDAIGDLPPVTDPGTAFINNGVSTLNVGLVRQSSITSPSVAWSGLEWNTVTAGTYSDWGTHTMNCPLNIEKITEFTEITLFPNPNNGSFEIITLKNLKNYNINIINIFGEIIYSNEFINSEIKLNLESGIYFINLFNKQEIITTRFVVL